MPRSQRAAYAICFAAFGAVAPVSAQAAGAPACVRELARTENSLVKTLVRVRGSGLTLGKQRCALYQDHAAIVSKARDVFSRCKTGAERDTDVGQLDGALSDANAVIAKTCTN